MSLRVSLSKYLAAFQGKLFPALGQKKAVAIAVRNASGLRHRSKLDERLAGGQARPERGASVGARPGQARSPTGAMRSC